MPAAARGGLGRRAALPWRLQAALSCAAALRALAPAASPPFAWGVWPALAPALSPRALQRRRSEGPARPPRVRAPLRAAGRDGEAARGRGSVAGGVGGAVLGGLLLGPLGAVFGASLGSDWGRQKAQDEAAIAEMGLDAEMVAIAQQVSLELAAAMSDQERVGTARDGLAARAEQLAAEVRAKEGAAMEALEAEDEDLARGFLGEKLRAQGKLDELKVELEKAEQRCATVGRNVGVLEQRATDVARLLERARVATGVERTNLADEASALGMSRPRDPLLERFERLERGERD